MAIKWCVRCKKRPIGYHRVKYCEPCAIEERDEKQRQYARDQYQRKKGVKKRSKPTVTIRSVKVVPKTRKARVCLRCRELFQSDGPQNRICKICTRRTANVVPNRYVYHEW